MNVNRTLTLPLLSALLVAFGCANSNPDEAKKIKIGVSIPAADHGWTAGVGYWAKTQMEKYPDIEWVYATASEPGKQTSDIEDMMTQGVDRPGRTCQQSRPDHAGRKKGEGPGNLSRQRGSRLHVTDRRCVS